MSKFRKDLEVLINQNSIENGSNTPDFILADYLVDCLKAFDKAVEKRSKWYGGKTIHPNEEVYQLKTEPSDESYPLLGVI